MKRNRSLFLVLLFGLLFTSSVLAQESPISAEEAAADLRLRLVEVQTREAERQARLFQLDEALQPQNIERSLAGIGSTRPEELREQRRRELTIEKDLVRKQLELLETSRVRLEAAIQAADSRAYHQSAQGYSANDAQAEWLYSLNPRRLIIASVTLLGLLAVGSMVALIRRLY